MLTVYGPTARVGRLNASPFVVKLETWLRLAGLPYQFKPASPLKAPKGKVPYIEEDGVMMGDSQFIIDHLIKRHGLTLDDHLSEVERATGRAVRRMLEEGTYFCTLHYRWLTPQGWAAYKPIMKAIAPGLMLELIRRNLRKRGVGQGTGRHTDDEILGLACADLRAVSAILGDRPFLLGDRPSSADATVYAFDQGNLTFPADNPIKAAVQSCPNLVAYVARMTERCWPEGELAPR